jgi:DNA-binding transcriptional LysR family regulator
MNLRHLRYLAALAREGNFHRAATRVHISQPTLSAAIRSLERELGVELVRREHRRYQDLTATGYLVLERARKILDTMDALIEDLSHSDQALKGDLRLGVIPTVEPAAGLLSAALKREHPGITLTLFSKTSDEIIRGIEDRSLDGGLSYVPDRRNKAVLFRPLYAERYVLLAKADLIGKRRNISWAEAARLPLVLLNRDMQNRKLIGQHFANLQLSTHVAVEASTLVSVLAQVKAGLGAGIVPEALVHMTGPLEGLRVIHFRGGDFYHQIGLLLAQRDPLPSLSLALVQLIEKVISRQRR